MIPLLKHFLASLLTDEVAFRRWSRSCLMALGAWLATMPQDELAAAIESYGLTPRTAGMLTMMASMLITSSRRAAK